MPAEPDTHLQECRNETDRFSAFFTGLQKNRSFQADSYPIFTHIQAAAQFPVRS